MDNIEYSRQLQEKFELYLLALTFTLLGLAVQTAKFGSFRMADALEILGWIALAISGLSGLSRFEWVPVAIKTQGQLEPIRKELARFEEAAAQGVQVIPVSGENQPVSTQSLIADRTTAIGAVEAHLKKIERAVLVKYSIHKWAFVLGILLLVAARGYSPVTGFFADPTKAAAACGSQPSVSAGKSLAK